MLSHRTNYLLCATKARNKLTINIQTTNHTKYMLAHSDIWTLTAFTMPKNNNLDLSNYKSHDGHASSFGHPHSDSIDNA